MSYLTPITNDIRKAILDGRAFTRLYTSASATDFGYAIKPSSGKEVVVYGFDMIAPGTISQVDFGYWDAATGFSTDTGVSTPVPLVNQKQDGAAFGGTLYFDIASVNPPDDIMYHLSSSGLFFPSTLRRVHNKPYNPSETLARVILPESFVLHVSNGKLGGVRIQNGTSGANKIQLWWYER